MQFRCGCTPATAMLRVKLGDVLLFKSETAFYNIGTQPSY